MSWYIAGLVLLFFASCYIPLAWILGQWIRIRQQHRAERKKLVYLTFDDGPGSRLTSQILDILGKNKIRASFFLLGRNIAGREPIVHRIQSEGHYIASHSFSHLHAWKRWPWTILADIQKGWQSIGACLPHSKNRYAYRPPYGKITILTWVYLMIFRIPIIYWSIDSGDTWSAESRDPEYASVQIRKRGGGIVLFHDFDRSTDATDAFLLHSLESVIQIAQQMNLQFATVDTLS